MLNLFNSMARMSQHFILNEDKSGVVIGFPNHTSGFIARVRENFGDSYADDPGAALMDLGSRGITLLERYALGMDPINPEKSKSPEIQITDNKIGFRKDLLIKWLEKKGKGGF